MKELQHEVIGSLERTQLAATAVIELDQGSACGRDPRYQQVTAVWGLPPKTPKRYDALIALLGGRMLVLNMKLILDWLSG